MSFHLFDLTAQRAELSPDRVALHEHLTGRQVTYAELDDRAARAAGLLAASGIETGDRIAILCRNRIEFFELLFACAKLGAILVPLNWRMPARELAPLMDDCAARLLIHGAEDAEAAAEVAADHCLALDDPDAYADRRDAAEPLPPRDRWPAEEPWYLIYTSGTTGMPKAVIQTYGMALANHVNITQAMGLRGDDTHLNFLPLFHTAGINLTTLPALIDGATVLMLPGFEVDPIVELIDQGRLSTFFGVPACYQAIALHDRFEAMDLGGVRCWGCGGAPLPDVLVQRYAKRGVTVLNGMGMTETGPTVFLMDAEHAAAKIGSVGKPQILSRVRLVGADGQDVAQGEAGELWFAGPGVTPGYWNRPEETAQALVNGEWLRSGDLGRQDADGYYYIVGRLKEMYISGGENVYPAEVENQLAEHPAVLEAAVIGVTDERWGEVGRAYLMLNPGAAAPGEAELSEFCRQRLAAYKVPRSFVVVDDFPRTAAGKVQKHLLADLDASAVPA